MRRLRIGTRGSKLALWQANWVRDLLTTQHAVDAEIVVLKTEGDRYQQKSVSAMGLKGVFIKELEEGLLDGLVDIAVHSMKDLPTEIPSGLSVSAIMARTEARDCVITRRRHGIEDLPPVPRVGTSSLRRKAQLRTVRPDWKVFDIRGNIETRLARLDAGEFDALVLAKAGLDRLGYGERISEVFSETAVLPAVGQGALGIESRRHDAGIVALIEKLDDGPSHAAISAERALLHGLHGGCQAPLGAWGRAEGEELVIDAGVFALDGSAFAYNQIRGSVEDAERLGRELSRKLIAMGASRILELSRGAFGQS